MLASWVLLTDPFVNVFRSMAQPPCLALFTITLLNSASLPAFICLAGGSHLLFLSLHISAACAVAITLSPVFVLEWFLKQNLPRGSLFFKAGRRFMPPFAAVQTQCSLPLLTPSDLQLPWGKPPLELLLSKCLSCYPLRPSLRLASPDGAFINQYSVSMTWYLETKTPYNFLHFLLLPLPHESRNRHHGESFINQWEFGI